MRKHDPCVCSSAFFSDVFSTPPSAAVRSVIDQTEAAVEVRGSLRNPPDPRLSELDRWTEAEAEVAAGVAKCLKQCQAMSYLFGPPSG